MSILRSLPKDRAITKFFRGLLAIDISDLCVPEMYLASERGLSRLIDCRSPFEPLRDELTPRIMKEDHFHPCAWYETRATSFPVGILLAQDPRPGHTEQAAYPIIYGIDGRINMNLPAFVIEMNEEWGSPLVRLPDDATISISPYYEAGIIEAISSVLFANSLANCANVKVERIASGRERKRPGSEHRGIVWHRLVIGMPSAKKVAGQKSLTNSTPVTRLHIQRGHFKTYTAEKPLLGQHVGRFWWHQHARGSKEVGEVLKSYVVRQPEAAA